MAESAAVSAVLNARPTAEWPPSRHPVNSSVPPGRTLSAASRATCSGSSEMGVQLAACRLDVEPRRAARGGPGPVSNTWSIGVGSSSKNLPSRSKSVASKAAMLAPSSRPTRWTRSGSRAVRITSAPSAELAARSRGRCPSCRRSRGASDRRAAVRHPCRVSVRVGLLCRTRGTPWSVPGGLRTSGRACSENDRCTVAPKGLRHREGWPS